MNIEKLPSGSYRLTQQVNGKRYRLTIDHKPTKDEAIRLMARQLNSAPSDLNNPSMTVLEACRGYISVKQNVLSPATVRLYNDLTKALSDRFASLRLTKVTTSAFQKEINDYSASHAPTSTATLGAFLKSVFTMHGVLIGKVKYPQKKKKDIYIPTKEEVQAITAYFTGSRFEAVFKLATFGLRKGELCALTPADIVETTVHVNKSKAYTDDGHWIIKSTKTTESEREIDIPLDLAELIHRQGYVYKGHPGRLNPTLNQAQDKLGIPRFSVHKFRHFFASYLHQLGYSDKQIIKMGGWKTNAILSTIYQHAMEVDKARQKAAADIGSLF